ncbi:MAG: ABC transporter [Clostridiales bacterium 43-6]|nr:MAG: ABC transporter [Clostridiales bacterium 43-6]
MIEVNNLTKKYGNHLAVENASFVINDGEILGLLGPNGAGKSTIMNIVTGYLSSTDGSVTISGYDILENPVEAKRHIGYLPEQPPLYVDMTVKEYLNYVYDLKKVKIPRKPHLAEICKLVKIEGVYDRIIKNLSKGYRQRVGIAQALIGNPDVLILDEPTVGLDPKQIIEIRDLIKKLGKNHTVIFSSHILSEIQAVCERVIIINKGKVIADDTPDTLSRKISDNQSLVIRVDGPYKAIETELKTISGIKKVSYVGIRDSFQEFIVDPIVGYDIRKPMFKLLASKNWPLMLLKSNEMTLEDIFLRLTDDSSESVNLEKVLRESKETKLAEAAQETDDDNDEIINQMIHNKEDK